MYYDNNYSCNLYDRCLVDLQTGYVICPTSLSIYIHSEYVIYVLLEEPIAHLLEEKICLFRAFIETYAIIRSNSLVIWPWKVPRLFNYITKLIIVGWKRYLLHYYNICRLEIWYIFKLKALIYKRLIFLVFRYFSMYRPIFEVCSV